MISRTRWEESEACSKLYSAMIRKAFVWLCVCFLMQNSTSADTIDESLHWISEFVPTSRHQHQQKIEHEGLELSAAASINNKQWLRRSDQLANITHRDETARNRRRLSLVRNTDSKRHRQIFTPIWSGTNSGPTLHHHRPPVQDIDGHYGPPLSPHISRAILYGGALPMMPHLEAIITTMRPPYHRPPASLPAPLGLHPQPHLVAQPHPHLKPEHHRHVHPLHGVYRLPLQTGSHLASSTTLATPAIKTHGHEEVHNQNTVSRRKYEADLKETQIEQTDIDTLPGLEVVQSQTELTADQHTNDQQTLRAAVEIQHHMYNNNSSGSEPSRKPVQTSEARDGTLLHYSDSQDSQDYLVDDYDYYYYYDDEDRPDDQLYEMMADNQIDSTSMSNKQLTELENSDDREDGPTQITEEVQKETETTQDDHTLRGKENTQYDTLTPATRKSLDEAHVNRIDNNTIEYIRDDSEPKQTDQERKTTAEFILFSNFPQFGDENENRQGYPDVVEHLSTTPIIRNVERSQHLENNLIQAATEDLDHSKVDPKRNQHMKNNTKYQSASVNKTRITVSEIEKIIDPFPLDEVLSDIGISLNDLYNKNYTREQMTFFLKQVIAKKDLKEREKYNGIGNEQKRQININGTMPASRTGAFAIEQIPSENQTKRQEQDHHQTAETLQVKPKPPKARIQPNRVIVKHNHNNTESTSDVRTNRINGGGRAVSRRQNTPKTTTATTKIVPKTTTASTETVPKPTAASTETVPKPTTATTETVPKTITESTKSKTKTTRKNTNEKQKHYRKPQKNFSLAEILKEKGTTLAEFLAGGGNVKQLIKQYHKENNPTIDTDQQQEQNESSVDPSATTQAVPLKIYSLAEILQDKGLSLKEFIRAGYNIEKTMEEYNGVGWRNRQQQFVKTTETTTERIAAFLTRSTPITTAKHTPSPSPRSDDSTTPRHLTRSTPVTTAKPTSSPSPRSDDTTTPRHLTESTAAGVSDPPQNHTENTTPAVLPTLISLLGEKRYQHRTTQSRRINYSATANTSHTDGRHLHRKRVGPGRDEHSSYPPRTRYQPNPALHNSEYRYQGERFDQPSTHLASDQLFDKVSRETDSLWREEVGANRNRPLDPRPDQEPDTAMMHSIIASGVVGGCALCFFVGVLIFCRWQQQRVGKVPSGQAPTAPLRASSECSDNSRGPVIASLNGYVKPSRHRSAGFWGSLRRTINNRSYSHSPYGANYS